MSTLPQEKLPSGPQNVVRAGAGVSAWLIAHRLAARAAVLALGVVGVALFAAYEVHSRRDSAAAQFFADGCKALEGKVVAPAAASAKAPEAKVASTSADGRTQEPPEPDEEAELEGDRLTFASEKQRWSTAHTAFVKAEARRGPAGIGALSGLLAAGLEERLGEAERSRQHFDALRHSLKDDERLLFLATERYAYQCEARGDYDGALEALAPLAAAPQRFYADRATLHRARLFEAKGDTQGAIAALESIEQQFPRTSLRHEVGLRLAALEQSAGAAGVTTAAPASGTPRPDAGIATGR